MTGLFTLWIALASPMDVFNGFVLTAHMLQHMLLMMIAPPLLLLGSPLVPMVRGLPIFAAREFAGPFLNWSVSRRVGTALTNPVVALVLMGVVMFAWHSPVLYELALRSPAWHQTEHACFLVASLIFWWPVVQPWPSRSSWPRWAMVPYLLIADLQNTVLSAILVFSDRILYPSYSAVPRLFRFSALEDQVAAGSIMWVVGSLAFIVPAIVIAVQCLSKRRSQDAFSPSRRREGSSLDALFSRLPGFLPSHNSTSSRWSSERAQALSFLVLFAAVALGFVVLLTGGSDDDDQALRFQQASATFAVSVFAPSDNFAGQSSALSMLVQDQATHEVLLDAAVDLAAQPSGARAASPIVRATNAESPNKLLQSAELDLPTEGDWIVNINVTRGAASTQFAMPLRVGRPETGAEYPTPWIVIAVLSVVLFGVYFSRRRSPRTGHPAQA